MSKLLTILLLSIPIVVNATYIDLQYTQKLDGALDSQANGIGVRVSQPITTGLYATGKITSYTKFHDSYNQDCKDSSGFIYATPICDSSYEVIDNSLEANVLAIGISQHFIEADDGYLEVYFDYSYTLSNSEGSQAPDDYFDGMSFGLGYTQLFTDSWGAGIQSGISKSGLGWSLVIQSAYKF